MSKEASNNSKHWNQLLEKLEIEFKNRKLLIQSFTHSSYVNENSQGNEMSNERLEFLGDAVLELAISRHLYDKFPTMPEGELTKLRAAIVCESSLVALAEELDFAEYVLLGRGESRSGGRFRASLLADAFEAFVGALFIDQGMEVVLTVLEKVVFPKIAAGVFNQIVDHKSLLQEKVQKSANSTLKYEVTSESGPAHDRLFDVEVYVDDDKIGFGTGKSKKEAEQNAAAMALEKIE